MTGFGEWLLGILQSILQYFVDLLLAQANWFWDALLSWLGTGFIIGIIQTTDTMFSAIPPGVWFFANVCQAPVGVTMILSAYLVRFFIRRIPIIG